jgi:competence protein ComEA
MNQDSRVIDAIAAAGGATDEADLAGINLARRVRDEEQYYIPAQGETPPLTLESAGTSGNQTNVDGLIDLNTASIDQLQTLPGIGPVLAGAIVEYRQGSGPFQTVDDIVNVPRIGPATLERIRGLVTTLASR